MIFSPLPGIVGKDFRKTQGFGERPDVYKPLKGHSGIDIAGIIPGDTNVKVYSPHEGWLQIVYDKNGFGNYVKIVSDPIGTNRTRRVSILGHLASISAKPGFIAAREPVGIMGMTGWADGIHVHWDYFLTDTAGNILQKDNGFNGRIDISPFAVHWIPGSIASPISYPFPH